MRQAGGDTRAAVACLGSLSFSLKSNVKTIDRERRRERRGRRAVLYRHAVEDKAREKGSGGKERKGQLFLQLFLLFLPTIMNPPK